MSAIEQGDHVLSPVAIEAACDELVNDDCSVVRALHGTLQDFAVPVESGRYARDSKIPVVREEEAKFNVCRQIVEDHGAEGGFPVVRGRALLAPEAVSEGGMNLQRGPRS